MSANPPDTRIDPENLMLYSANLEANNPDYFPPTSAIEISQDNESQNFQAVKASELKDHLLQMMNQKQGTTGIDEISSFSNTQTSMKEILTEKEKQESLITFPMAFRDKLINSTELLCRVDKDKSEGSGRSSRAQNAGESVWEQDGLYVPKEVKMKKGNYQRVTTRINWSANEREMFFDEDGKLRNDAPHLRKIPPPFKKDSIKPPYYDAGKTQLLPATVWGLENSATSRDIRVEVNSIQFTVHHLSSDEDILALRLKQLYVSYLHTVQYPRANYFATRIKALRRDLKVHSENRAKILQEIVDCHRMRDNEEQTTRMKLEQLLVTWHELKDIRTKNGYNITNVALRWQSKKFSEEAVAQEQEKFEKAILKRAKEVVEFSALNDEDLDLDNAIEEIKQNHQDMGLRMPGDPIWRPVLYEIETSADDQLPKEEIQRRNLISKARIYVAFMMGTTEMRSNDTELTLQFVSPIDTGCKASTMRVPNDVRIHIYEYGDQHLSEIACVPIPVLNGIPKEFISYEFAAESKTKAGLVIQGYITARVFVEPDTVATQTVLPEIRSVAPTRVQVTNRFLSVPKYLEIVAKHDPNDPYIAAAIGSVMAGNNEQTIFNKFAIDVDSDHTKFESMAPSNLCEVIHKKAYDKLYREPEQTQDQEPPKLQLQDIIKDSPKPTFNNFFDSLWRFLTFRRGRKPKDEENDVLVDPTVPTHRLEQFSKLVLNITGFSNLPSEVSSAVARISYNDEEVETSNWDVGTSRFVGGNTGYSDLDTKKKHNNQKQKPGLTFTFNVTKEDEKVPHFSQIEDRTIRVDLFDAIQNRFLASITIPLRSIFANGKIEGDFSLFTPPFNLGYTPTEEPMQIQMSLELTPQLLPPNFVDQNPCSEKINVQRRAQQIVDHFNGDRRRIVPLAPTQSENHNTVLVCRYISPQAPPEGVTTISDLLSFVSIIPTTKDSSMPGSHTQWLTSQQFIDEARGTSTEHAILLCNFLKYLEYDSYVILGHDAIQGLCAFVGLKNGATSMQILDPCAGREVEMNHTTLQDVGTVFNDRNAWFNQQKEGIPIDKINWNFNDSGRWVPFFNRDFPRTEFASPQESELQYEESPPEHLESLQSYVEGLAISATEELRGHRSTEWDEEASVQLSKILKSVSKRNNEKLKIKLQTLKEEMGRKVKLIGAPFFIAYVYDEDNIDKLKAEITEELKAREVYDNSKRKVKFAHAVNITQFPNDVYGIWILLAAIAPAK